jgi:hypothetical protein
MFSGVMANMLHTGACKTDGSSKGIDVMVVGRKRASPYDAHNRDTRKDKACDSFASRFSRVQTNDGKKRSGLNLEFILN